VQVRAGLVLKQELAMADTCELGIPSIDDEHRELVRLFDAFASCVKGASPAEEMHAIVQQAISIANEHFAHEERLCDETGYPQTEDHKFRHRHLRLQLTTLVGDTIGMAARDPVTIEHLFEMRRLLREHSDGPDRDLAEHLKRAGAH
jgi:hemerythrin